MENTHRYDDIKHLPHHQSATRPHMSLHDRAAQFAPFAALTGYEDMVREEARMTSRQIELSESEKQRLDRKLARISESLAAGDCPKIRVCFFVPDDRKSGGRYDEYEGCVRKLDPISRCLQFRSPTASASAPDVEIDSLLEIHGDLVDALDDWIF